MALVLAFIATLLHFALCFVGAPLVQGVIDKIRARLLGRRGPPWRQPYRHLAKLLRKATLVPDTATAFFTIWPLLALVALALAAMLVPSFCDGLLTAKAGDYVVVIGLLALARTAMLLAGLENGSAQAGAVVARALVPEVFALAILLVLWLVFAGGSGAVAGHPVAAGLALFALLMLAFILLPDDEALKQDYAGRLRALLDYAGMLRILVWINLLSAYVGPFGMAHAAVLTSWPVGILAWGAKLVVFSTLLAGADMLRNKLPLARVPAALGLALALALLSCLFAVVVLRGAA